MKVKKIRERVDKFFDVELSIPGVNGDTLHSPLYYASSICEKELKELNPPLYNDNQEKQFINGKFGWFILSNKWEPTEQEIEYERQLIIKQLEGYGPSQMRTRHASGTGLLTGFPAKPATR
jgi:hypothetical protein